MNEVIDVKSVLKNTSEFWKAADLVISKGLITYETDTNLIKISDGIHSYNDLPYVESNGSGGSDLSKVKSDIDNINDELEIIDNQLKDKADLTDVMQKNTKVEETIDGKKIFNQLVAKNEFVVADKENSGNVIIFNFDNNTAQIISNNGLDFISSVNFTKEPSTESILKFSELADNKIANKKQINQALEDEKLYQVAYIGKPEDSSLNTTYQIMPISTEEKIANKNYDDLVVQKNQITFNKDGMIHIKYSVNLAELSNDELLYSIFVDDKELSNRIIKVYKNSGIFEIETYANIKEGQNWYIKAKSINNETVLKYQNVTLLVQYV